ncbi:MAG: hypothetical protein K940chlam6_01275 [Chlamydiae bacterium]|nr:hypothetical protein [Chlamydiota bacterium]NGX47619.1 hypothetical protein [Chlamydiota bacterium]
MRDTTPEIEQKVREMMELKSPTERVKMGFSMYETSKYIVTQSILHSNPHISKSDLRREIFLRFYGDDFTPEKREKIIKHLEQHS